MTTQLTPQPASPRRLDSHPRRNPILLAALALIGIACGDGGSGASTSGTGGSRVTFAALSEGRSSADNVGQAKFMKNGLAFYAKTGALGGGRGFNVAVIDRTTGEPMDPGRNFDTFESRDSGSALAELVKYLDGVADGRLILMAIAEEGGLTDYDVCQKIAAPWLISGIDALEKLGCRKLRDYCFRGSWAVALVKGEGRALDEKVDAKQSVTVEALVTVGR